MAKTATKNVDIVAIRLPAKTVKVLDKHLVRINRISLDEPETRSSLLRKLLVTELSHAS